MNNIHKISVLANDSIQQSVSNFVDQGKTFNDAIGIIIQTPVIGIVMSFDEWEAPWSNNESVITEEQSEVAALQTLSGLELTKCICEAQKNNEEGATAAQYCWEYNKANLQWYLPSLYELGIIAAYKDEINEALKQLSCPDNMLLSASWYWSSSEGSQGGSWHVNFGSGGFYNGYGKYYSSNVRAVAAFSPCGSSCDEPRKESSPAPDKELSDDQLVALLRNRGYTGTLTKSLEV